MAGGSLSGEACECHNAVNGLGATNSLSRRDPANATGADPHNAWMSVKAVVSLFAAWRGRSPTLLAFGGDSAIDLFPAVVVLWRFGASAEHEHAAR
jgi:hypothetical protein